MSHKHWQWRRMEFSRTAERSETRSVVNLSFMTGCSTSGCRVLFHVQHMVMLHRLRISYDGYLVYICTTVSCVGMPVAVHVSRLVM